MSPQRTCRSLLPDPVCLEVRCRNSGPGGMGKGPEDLFSSVTSPSTLQHNRVIYLPTLSATSTIRKKLKGWDTGRESRYPCVTRCGVDSAGGSLNQENTSLENPGGSQSPGCSPLHLSPASEDKDT